MHDVLFTMTTELFERQIAKLRVDQLSARSDGSAGAEGEAGALKSCTAPMWASLACGLVGERGGLEGGGGGTDEDGRLVGFDLAQVEVLHEVCGGRS